jgi:hypothetical protein
LPCLILPLVLVGPGCRPNPGPSLRAAEPLRRVPAIAQAESSQELPKLIDALNDADPAIRLASIGRLHEITGERFGYEYWRLPEQRVDAIARWKSWLAARAAGGVDGR